MKFRNPLDDIIEVEPRTTFAEPHLPVRVSGFGSEVSALCPTSTELDRLLPKRVGQDTDPAGLSQHENLHAALADKIFNGFSYVCAQIAVHDTKVRESLTAEDQTTEFPTMQLDRFFTFGLRHITDGESGRTTYEFYRADGGNDDGGFFVTKSADGATIITRDLESTPEHDKAYASLLLQAQKSLLLYANHMHVSAQGVEKNEDEDHLSASDIQKLREQVAHDKTKRARAKKATQQAGRKAVAQASRLVTVEDTKAPIPGVRKLSKLRVALLALALPLPGYSSSIGDTGLPRPASIEFAGDVAGAIADAWPEPAPPQIDPVVAYDERSLDLPEGAKIRPGKAGQSVPVLESVPTVPDDIAIIRSSDNAPLAGNSPRVVEIDQPLAPQSCVRFPLSPSAQNQDIAFAAADSRVAEKFEIDAEPEAVYLCNTSSDLVTNGRFYFDTLK